VANESHFKLAIIPFVAQAASSPKIERMKQTSTVILKVVFTCNDLTNSSDDAFELLTQLDGLLKKFSPKSEMSTKEMSLNNSDPLPEMTRRLRKLKKVGQKSRRP